MKKALLLLLLPGLVYGHYGSKKYKHIHSNGQVLYSNGTLYWKTLKEQQPVEEKPLVAKVDASVKPAVKLRWPEDIVPKRAELYIGDVKNAINSTWPTLSMRSYIPAQIEQESCYSATHSKCWNPTAELKTSREYGFGLGQLTKAYTKTGKLRFDSWAEIKEKDPSLKDWRWEDRYNPLLQIKAIVVKNLVNYKLLTFPVSSDIEKFAFLAATYNGGSVLKDRRLCTVTPDCDNTSWFSKNARKKYAVESFSTKSRAILPGYSKSLFAISREYPIYVIYKRRAKYVIIMGN